jgi:L-asparaginase II
VKALQALPLIESGAAVKLELTDAEIALACASHSGEDAHIALAAAMLGKAGRDERALECGAHWPLGEAAAWALARSGRKPSPLHNNCSGKHAGFVCLACAAGVDPEGYVSPDHFVQRAVTQALAEAAGTRLGQDNRAVDGCSIPAYAIPLRALALGFARFATGRGLAAGRARAAARIRAAVAKHPAVVAGQGRFDAEVMTLLGPRAFIKAGAEGVFCAALPELGLGLAVKADDGGKRAAEVMTAALLRRFGGFGAALDRFAAPPLVNWNGVEVGGLRPAGPLG